MRCGVALSKVIAEKELLKLLVYDIESVSISVAYVVSKYQKTEQIHSETDSYGSDRFTGVDFWMWIVVIVIPGMGRIKKECASKTCYAKRCQKW